MFHYSQQVAVAIVDWKVITIVFFDQLWRMSVEGVNAVAGQELKDPLGQPASPAQPGASQKWAFPLTALCAVQCAPCSCSIFFQIIFKLSPFSASLRCTIDFSTSWITDNRKATLSSTRGFRNIADIFSPRPLQFYIILHWVLSQASALHLSCRGEVVSIIIIITIMIIIIIHLKLQRRSGEWRGWIY